MLKGCYLRFRLSVALGYSTTPLIFLVNFVSFVFLCGCVHCSFKTDYLRYLVYAWNSSACGFLASLQCWRAVTRRYFSSQLSGHRSVGCSRYRSCTLSLQGWTLLLNFTRQLLVIWLFTIACSSVRLSFSVYLEYSSIDWVYEFFLSVWVVCFGVFSLLANNSCQSRWFFSSRSLSPAFSSASQHCLSGFLHELCSCHVGFAVWLWY